jgi:hypothetical protein
MSLRTPLPTISLSAEKETIFSRYFLIQFDSSEMVQMEDEMVQLEDSSDWFRYFPAEIHVPQTQVAELELSLIVVDLPLLTEPPFPASQKHK